MLKKKDLECAYCNHTIFGGSKNISDNMIEPMVVVKVDMMGCLYIRYEQIHEFLDINYCPMCGRKLRKKDVVLR